MTDKLTKDDLILNMLKQIQHSVERNEDELRVFKKDVNDQFKDLRQDMDQKFDKVYTEFDKVYAEFDKVYAEFDKVREEIDDLRKDTKQEFADFKQDLDGVRSRDVSWNAKIISLVLLLNSAISFIIVKIFTSGVNKIADVGKIFG